MNRKVVLVMYQYSVVVKGFEKKLKEMQLEVEVVLAEEQDRFTHLSSWAGLFVFYLPGDLLDDQKKKDQLVKMLGVTQSRNTQAIIVGEAKYHADLIRELPVVDVCDWFERPVDMTKFANSVEKALSDFDVRMLKRKILIVDDDPSYAAMVREWIKDTYQVGIVSNGMKAITYLLDKPVDLILLDYEMPVVDGPQVLEMLRQEPATQNIPVIFLTGNGKKEAVARVMALRPAGYLLKSTTRIDLLNFLKEKLK